MKDNYPTRKSKKGKFINRICPVVYEKPELLSEAQYEFYKENGYLRIESFFDKKQVTDLLHESILLRENKNYGHITIEPNSNSVRSITGVHEKNLFKNFAENKEVTSIITALLGDMIYIHQSRINYKKALDGTGWSWHSDFETWHSQDGMPNMRCLSVMIPLLENTECNGSLIVIPKSHNIFYSCKKEKTVSAEENFADQKEGVPDEEAIKYFFKNSNGAVEMIKCKPTDLILFDCNTIHVSTSNLSNNDRTNLFFVYNSISNRLVSPFKGTPERPNEMASRGELNILS